MEVEVKTGCEQLKVIIYCRERDAQVQALVQQLQPKAKLAGWLDEKQYLLDEDAILYFESVDNKTFAYTVDEIYAVQSKLYELEQALSAHFMRISKACIVNIAKISALQVIMGGRIRSELVNGEQLCISRSYAKAFRAKIKASAEQSSSPTRRSS